MPFTGNGSYTIIAGMMNSPDMQRSDEIQAKVKKWLIEDGFSIEDKSESGLRWFFVAKGGGEHGYGISQRNDMPDEVYIRIDMNFPKSVRDSLAALNGLKRKEFYSEVRFALLALDVEFYPTGNPIWEIMNISIRIFEDALTKDEFLRRVSKVQRAVLALGWMVNDRLPLPDPPKGKKQSVN